MEDERIYPYLILTVKKQRKTTGKLLKTMILPTKTLEIFEFLSFLKNTVIKISKTKKKKKKKKKKKNYRKKKSCQLFLNNLLTQNLLAAKKFCFVLFSVCPKNTVRDQ